MQRKPRNPRWTVRPRATLLAATLTTVGSVQAQADHPAELAAPLSAPAKTASSAVEISTAQWWTSFGDPQLSEVMAQALSGSLELQAARLKVGEARANLDISRSGRQPTLSWDSNIDLAPGNSLGFRFGGTGGPGAGSPPAVYWTGSSSLNAAYEVDLLGNIGLNVDASRSELSAARSSAESQELTLGSAVSNAYFDTVAAKARQGVVEQQIATASTLLDLTVAHFHSGRARATDVLQQRQQLASASALRPQVRAQIRNSSQRLAVLLGSAPNTPIETSDTLPSPRRASSPLDSPALVQARPDVRAAAARTRAAQQRHRATPGYFTPRLSLSAGAGVQAIDVVELNHQTYWGAGARLSIPLYNGGRDLATVRQREVAAHQAANQLRTLQLEATRQIQAAQAAQEEGLEILEATQAELKFAKQSYHALRDRYLQGEGEVVTLLSAFTAFRQAELNWISAQRNLLTAQIELQSSTATTLPLRPLSGSPRSVTAAPQYNTEEKRHDP